MVYYDPNELIENEHVHRKCVNNGNFFHMMAFIKDSDVLTTTHGL